MTEQNTAAPMRGAIKQIGSLDLLGMIKEDDLADITSIENVGVILVPEPLVGKLMSIPMTQVGAVVPVPVGDNVKVISGQMRTTGDALANVEGNADDIMLIAGQVIFTTPVEKVGYKKLIIAGQILAPHGSEGALSAGLTRLAGQIVYYAPNTRLFFGDERLGAEFLALLDEPTNLCIFGNMTIEANVPPDLLKAKIKSIMLFGNISAPSLLVPMVQFLTTEKFGSIKADEASTAGDDLQK